MLMPGLLLDGANRHPDRDCFHWVDRDRGFRYGEAAERMADAAGMLQDPGLRSGDRLTILAHNGLDYPVAMFGAWQLGAIAALVNVRFADHTPTVVVYTHDLEDQSDIEEELCSIDAIRSAALVGVAGADGLRPVAAVTLAGTAALDIARCKAQLADTTPYNIDRLEIVVEDMPMTPTGKIAKAELARSLCLQTQA